MARCSICHTLIQNTDESASCPECQQNYHRSCWDGLGGCATYGCKEAVPAEKAPVTKQIGAGWGDEKTCPCCRRTIGASLLVCSCGAKFPYPEPMTRDEWRVWKAGQQNLSGTRKTLVFLFIFSLFGLPAPLLGPIAGVIAYKRREALAGADGTYLAIGFGAAALGATYTLIFLLLMMGL